MRVVVIGEGNFFLVWNVSVVLKGFSLPAVFVLFINVVLLELTSVSWRLCFNSRSSKKPGTLSSFFFFFALA